MDAIQVLFASLFGLLLIIVFGMNFIILPGAPSGVTFGAPTYSTPTESFENPPSSNTSTIEAKVKDVLEFLTVREICPLYDMIRDTMRKNEKANQQISDEEVNRRVEKNLALKIPGGALPCPLLTYPRPGSKDLEWLEFVNSIPDDYGARIVFMAMYAKEFLNKTETDLKSALSGQRPAESTEGFATICPPDVAASRREALNKTKESCILPETLTPDQIEDAIEEKLKRIVGTKNKLLQAQGIPVEIDIQPIIASANKSAAWLKQKKIETEQGTLAPTAPAPGL